MEHLSQQSLLRKAGNKCSGFSSEKNNQGLILKRRTYIKVTTTLHYWLRHLEILSIFSKIMAPLFLGTWLLHGSIIYTTTLAPFAIQEYFKLRFRKLWAKQAKLSGVKGHLTKWISWCLLAWLVILFISSTPCCQQLGSAEAQYDPTDNISLSSHILAPSNQSNKIKLCLNICCKKF